MTAANSFRRKFTKKNLRIIYHERIRSSGAVGIDRVHPELLNKQLSDQLDVITTKVKAGTYRFTPFKEKLISKGAGSHPRVISIPTARDRIVLRAICDLLAEVFPEAVSEIPQTKIASLKQALVSGGYTEYVKIDLCQFYPTIPHDKLMATLRSKIRKPEILGLIESAISTPTVPEQKGGKDATPNARGVPQGLAISNLLAEIFLHKLDSEIAAKSSIWYQRYVDDILILCADGASSKVADAVCSQLEKLGVTPHRLNGPDSKSKAGKLTDAFDFLGYHIVDGKLSIKKQNIQKFESSLAKIFTAYRHKLLMAKSPADKARALAICEWRLNLRITGCIFGGRRMGWVFYFSQITDTTRLRVVDNTIGSLLRRFSLVGKIHAKRLLKTFYECRRKDKSGHAYIQNFDEMPIDERRKILVMWFGAKRIARLSDRKVNQLFEMRISAAVKELEQDLGTVS
ncbi:MAG: reverse transcriptase [Rhodocyclales bacterium]|nr:reverse transcriptase [Rhodocyclales bacterium]